MIAPAGWQPVEPTQAEQLRAELLRQIPLGHVLTGQPLHVIGRYDADLLLRIDHARPTYAVVSLTGRTHTDPHAPRTVFYDSLDQIAPASQARPKHLSTILTIATGGALVALFQFPNAECNYLPLLSALSGFIAGASATATLVFLLRRRFLFAIGAALIAAPAVPLMLVSHMCP